MAMQLGSDDQNTCFYERIDYIGILVEAKQSKTEIPDKVR